MSPHNRMVDFTFILNAIMIHVLPLMEPWLDLVLDVVIPNLVGACR